MAENGKQYTSKICNSKNMPEFKTRSKKTQKLFKHNLVAIPMKYKARNQSTSQYKEKHTDKQIGTTSPNLKSQTALKKYYSGKERFYNKDLVNIQSAGSVICKEDNGSTTLTVKKDHKNLLIMTSI